jgi:hypothetical protein
VKANPLFVRTLDTGSADGRAGLYFIPEVFDADGIVVTKATYRTHPIQLSSLSRACRWKTCACCGTTSTCCWNTSAL